MIFVTKSNSHYIVEAPDEGKPSKMNFGGQKVPEISFV